MKKTLIFFASCAWLGPAPAALAQTFSLVNAVKIGNADFNQGFGIKALQDVYFTARNQSPLDIGLGAPLLLNAGPLEAPAWGKVNQGLSSTLCGGFLSGTNYVFIIDSDVNANGETLLSGHYTGVITAMGNNYPCGGSGNCGFVALVDANCQVTDFKTYQGNMNVSVSRVRWMGSDIVMGIAYAGTITDTNFTYTSAGNTDVLILKTSSLNKLSHPGQSPLSGVPDIATVSGTRYESVTSLDFDQTSNTLRTGLLAYGPGTYSSTYTAPGGSSQVITHAVQSNSAICLGSASSLALTDTIVVGANGGPFEVRGIHGSVNDIRVVGTGYNSTIYPPGAGPLYGNASQGMVALRFKKATGTYVNYWQSQYTTDNTALFSGTRPLDTVLHVMFVGGRLVKANSPLSGGQQPDAVMDHGLIYFLDTALTVIDSLIIGGTPGGNGFSQFNDASFDAAGDLYVTGYFIDTIDFDPSPVVFNLTSALPLYGDLFLARYNASALGMPEAFRPLTLTVYPNPAQDMISIYAGLKKTAAAKLSIFSFQGQLLYRKDFGAGDVIRDTWRNPGYGGGVYLLVLEYDGVRASKKFIMTD